MHTRLGTSVLATIVLTTLAGSVHAETIEVQASGMNFVPAEIVARPGDVIRWERVSGNHTVTSGTGCVHDGGYFDEPLNGGNPSFEWEVPADASGVIDYFCDPHCGSGMVGSIMVDEGAYVRFAAIESSTVDLSTPPGAADEVNLMEVGFDGGDADRFMMGFEVEGAHTVIELSVSGTGSIQHRDLDSGAVASYSAGSHTIVFATGAHGLLATGAVESISLQWNDPIHSGGGTDGDFILDEMSASNGASIWFTHSHDTETLWVGSANNSDSLTGISVDVIGADVERPFMWVGAVSGVGFSMPDEGSDMVDTLFPIGEVEISVESPGFFMLVLNNDDDDDGGDGGSGCGADLNGDLVVDGADLTVLLGSWGVCP